MTTIFGTTPVPALPQGLPDSDADAPWVDEGAHEGEIMLLDRDYVARLILRDVVRDIVWCRHLDEHMLAIGSEYGHHAYMVDISEWRILRELFIWRDEDRYCNRFGILVTPDEQRCVFLSDATIHVLSWRGDVLYVRRIETTDTFVSLDNDSITLLDVANGDLQFTLPFGHQ